MVDETYMLAEALRFGISGRILWGLGGLRTTEVTLGPPARLFMLLFNWSDESAFMALKAMHWLSGLIVILLIYRALHRTLFAADRSGLSFFLFIGVSLLFPVVAMAQKTFNYDLLSMLLAVYGLVLAGNAFRRRSQGNFLPALIAAALAAQEKLSASPVLWLVIGMAVYAYLDARRLMALRGRIMAGSLILYKYLGLAVAVILVSFGVILLMRIAGGEPVPVRLRNPVKMFLPLLSWGLPMLRLFGGDAGLSTVWNFFRDGPPSLLVILIAAAFAIAGIAVSAFCIVLDTAVHRLNGRFPHWPSVARRYLPRIELALVPAVALTGIIGTFTVRPYWAPVFMPENGGYLPGVSFNSMTLHFNASTYIGHTGRAIVFAYTVFINAWPTVLLGAFVAALLWNEWRSRRGERSTVPPYIRLLTIGSLGMPLCFALTHTPVQYRYFNIFLYLAALGAVGEIYAALRPCPIQWKAGGVGLLVYLMLIELVPFRPIVTSFRPIWSRYSQKYHTQPKPGCLNPWTLGGGEEVMLGGSKILRLHDSSSPVTIYYHYYGDWFGKPPNVRLLDMTDDSTDLRYTSNDYYILNRLSVTQGWLAFPYNLQPCATVAFRGYVQAWIFRGDRLKARGFAF